MGSMALTARYTRFRLPTVVAMVLVISYLHLRLGPDEAVAHVFLQDFYFLPIILASYWWGPWRGLITAAVVCVLYLPFVLLVHQVTPPLLTSGITQMALFLGVSLVVGWLRRREQHFLAEAQAAASLAAVGKAVASVAHDMKTPLMAIGGFSAQVRRKLPADSSDAHKLQVVVEQTARLEAMVKEMLDFSRPLELHAHPVDLPQLIEQTLEVASPLAEEHQVRLSAEVAPDLPQMRMDPERLQQALINLVGNAAQASPPGGEVCLGVHPREGELVLAVSDQGPGVPPAEREAILTPFYTTKKGGTGLGLAVVSKIAQAHGGQVEVDDNHPGGALFRLCLPLVPVEKDQEAQPSGPK